MKKKKMTIMVCTVLLLSAILVAAWACFIRSPKPKSEQPKDLAAFIASGEFAKLTPAKQLSYAEKLRNGQEPGNRRGFFEKMSEAERRRFRDNMRNLMEQRRNKEVIAYLKMSQEEKNRFLDDKIAEQDKRFEEMKKRFEQRKQQNSEKKDEKTDQPKRPTEEERAARMKERIENTPPELRAARRVMMHDMMARRAATGKSMPRPPRPR